MRELIIMLLASASLFSSSIKANINEQSISQQIEITEEDNANIDALTRMAQGEYFLIDTPEHQMQCAAVVECAMWRVMAGSENGFASSPVSVVSQPYQFHGYNPYAPVNEELREFVKAVYLRAMKVLDGADPQEVGCVLSPEYLWFWGDGTKNHFTDAYPRGNEWTFEWGNPYV